MEDPKTASNACAACRKYKRRCDKTLPSCTLCTRLHRPCDYQDRQTERDLKNRIKELETLVSSRVIGGNEAWSPLLKGQNSLSSDEDGSYSPAESALLRFQKLFLDPSLNYRHPVDIAPPVVPIPAAASAYIGDQRRRAQIMCRHFETVHQWMPIIGKVRLEQLAESQSDDDIRADFALLILAMILMQQVPESCSSVLQDPLYTTAKEFAAMLEMAGVHSLLKLQANLLLTVFEMGHGIFPAAYMTLGYCVTQAVALGLQNRQAPQMLEAPRTWINWEERQRVWLVIVVIDRYITSAAENRPLLTEDPKKSSHLPVDDAAWDRGVSLAPDRLFVSSPKDISASPFARVVQAAHLLGEVIRHTNDEPPDKASVREEVDLIYQALNSLLNVLRKDETVTLQCYNAVAICLSALMKLSDRHACDSFSIETQERLGMSEMALAREITVQCRDIMRRTISDVIALIDLLNVSGRLDEDKPGLSPWFFDCIYQTAMAAAWLGAAASAPESHIYAAQQAACVDILQRANRRWKVAGAYLEAINFRDADLHVDQY